MATQEAVNKAITSDKGTDLVPADRIETLLARVDIRKKFEEALGAKAPGFISSIVSAYKGNEQLKLCDPMSVISAAFVAATLDLPINSNLGFAHIVPYKHDGRPIAQFQMGWKGFVQLAIRTGQYKTMNAAEIYDGELKYWNRITGEIEFDLTAKKSDKVIGYVAFFRTLNGFEKYHFMKTEEVDRHAKKYSKSYQRGKGQWVDNFPAMALKTVIKLLLSKYGLLSIQMEKALSADQAVVDVEGEIQDYPDRPADLTVTHDAIEP